MWLSINMIQYGCGCKSPWEQKAELRSSSTDWKLPFLMEDFFVFFAKTLHFVKKKAFSKNL